MNTVKAKKLTISVACLIAAILLIATHSVVAQIKIGGIEITIPKRPKTPKTEKSVPKVETPVETSTTKTEQAKTESSPTSGKSNAQSDVWLDIIVNEINNEKKEVDDYYSSEPNRAFETSYWIPPAVSPRARQEYYKQKKFINETQQAALNPALDALATSLAKKLPLYKPNPSIFAYRNPSGEQMIKRSLQNAATLKVHKIGFAEAIWLIEKNEFGIPLNRYKHGYVWARDTGDDYPYCHLYVIYLQQNYEGGGTYGQVFTNIRNDNIVGCP